MPDSNQDQYGSPDVAIDPGDTASGVAAESAPAPVAPRRPGAFADPVVRRLSWLGALMLVAFLLTVVSALVMGVINPPAPRTAVERDLSVARVQIDAGSTDPEVWHSYILALITTEQYSKAERTIAQAEEAKIENPAKQYMLLSRVRLDVARKEFDQAIKDSDAAIAALNARLKYEKEQYEATKKPTTMIAEGLGPNYETLQLLRAEAYEGLGKKADAIASLDIYINLNERAADILVWRGDLKSASGDTTGAIEDYKSASLYMPGDKALRDKLAKLGVTDE